jgi:hypothetical protein
MCKQRATAAPAAAPYISTCAPQAPARMPPRAWAVARLGLHSASLALCVLLSLVASVHSNAAAAPTTKTFAYSGSVQQWAVPPGVTSVTAYVWGAGGAGGGWRLDKTSQGIYGGGGGFVKGTIDVTSISTLEILVGQGGFSSDGESPTRAYVAGGAAGSVWDVVSGSNVLKMRAAGGGGRSEIRANGASILIAGGGGGGGMDSTDSQSAGTADGGGGGGGLLDLNGQSVTNGGGGGTQSEGGTGISVCGSNYDTGHSKDGAQYKGGSMHNLLSTWSCNAHPGGGDGWYGGGAGGSLYGDLYGGGGGSSYKNPDYVDESTFQHAGGSSGVLSSGTNSGGKGGRIDGLQVEPPANTGDSCPGVTFTATSTYSANKICDGHNGYVVLEYTAASTTSAACPTTASGTVDATTTVPLNAWNADMKAHALTSGQTLFFEPEEPPTLDVSRGFTAVVLARPDAAGRTGDLVTLKDTNTNTIARLGATSGAVEAACPGGAGTVDATQGAELHAQAPATREWPPVRDLPTLAAGQNVAANTNGVKTIAPADATYGTGAYTVSSSVGASDWHNGRSGWNAFEDTVSKDSPLSDNIFDKSPDSSNCGATTDDSCGGVYDGTSNIVSGYNGVWIKLQLPEAIRLGKIKITPQGAYWGRWIKDYKVYGSNDDSAWIELLHEKNGFANDAVTEVITHSTNNELFQYFALVVNKNNGGEPFMVFNQWFLYEAAVTPTASPGLGVYALVASDADAKVYAPDASGNFLHAGAGVSGCGGFKHAGVVADFTLNLAQDCSGATGACAASDNSPWRNLDVVTDNTNPDSGRDGDWWVANTLSNTVPPADNYIFLEIDLESSREVVRVQIFSRVEDSAGNPLANRNTDYEIWIGNTARQASLPNKKCYQHDGEPALNELVWCVGSGRYLFLKFFKDNPSVGEVKIYGPDAAASTPTPGQLTSGYSLTLGGPDTGSAFAGLLGEAFVAPRALSRAELGLAIHGLAAYTGDTGADLQRWYTLDGDLHSYHDRAARRRAAAQHEALAVVDPTVGELSVANRVTATLTPPFTFKSHTTNSATHSTINGFLSAGERLPTKAELKAYFDSFEADLSGEDFWVAVWADEALTITDWLHGGGTGGHILGKSLVDNRVASQTNGDTWYDNTKRYYTVPTSVSAYAVYTPAPDRRLYALEVAAGQTLVAPVAGTFDWTGPWTVAAWLRAGAGTSGAVLQLQYGANPANTADAVTDANVAAGAWTHVALTYAAGASTVDLHVNGGAGVSAGIDPSAWAAGGSVQIASAAVDDLRVFSGRALTLEEVQTIAGATVDANAPVARWDFENANALGAATYGPHITAGLTPAAQEVRVAEDNALVLAAGETLVAPVPGAFDWTGDWTVAAWLRAGAGAGASGAVLQLTDGAPATATAVTAADFSTSAWTHVALTHAAHASTAALYVDGALRTAYTYAPEALFPSDRTASLYDDVRDFSITISGEIFTISSSSNRYTGTNSAGGSSTQTHYHTIWMFTDLTTYGMSHYDSGTINIKTGAYTGLNSLNSINGEWSILKTGQLRLLTRFDYFAGGTAYKMFCPKQYTILGKKGSDGPWKEIFRETLQSHSASVHTVNFNSANRLTQDEVFDTFAVVWQAAFGGSATSGSGEFRLNYIKFYGKVQGALNQEIVAVSGLSGSGGSLQIAAAAIDDLRVYQHDHSANVQDAGAPEVVFVAPPPVTYDFTSANDVSAWTLKAKEIDARATSHENLAWSGDWSSTMLGLYSSDSTEIQDGYVKFALPSAYNTITITSGNDFDSAAGTVYLYIDTQTKIDDGSAVADVTWGASTTSTRWFSYTDGDWLMLKENNAVILGDTIMTFSYLASSYGFCDDTDPDAASCVERLPVIDGDTGGWRLVRHIPASTCTTSGGTETCTGIWFDGDDNLMGTITRTPDVNFADAIVDGDVQWTKEFGNFDQYVISTGDQNKWLKFDKAELIAPYAGSTTSFQARILQSSTSPTVAYDVTWYNRNSNPEDPQISLGSISDANLLYYEYGDQYNDDVGSPGYTTAHKSFWQGHLVSNLEHGINVFVRDSTAVGGGGA